MSTLLMGCVLMGAAGGLAVLWKRRIEELLAIIAASYSPPEMILPIGAWL